MITRKQVADLQPGDVVELVDDRWPDVVMHGPLHASDEDTLSLGVQIIRHRGGEWAPKHKTLTVVSRAPRPLYVNHPRTEPVQGDLVRNAEDDSPPTVFLFASDEFAAPWYTGGGYFAREHMPDRLLLLVDGETGQVVQ